jgi:hypothetical protein
MMINRFSMAWLVLVMSAMSLASEAAERISVSGPIYFIADPAGAVEMEKGHSVLLARWNGVAAHEDKSSPWNQTRVDCVGMIDARSNGTWDASGYCMHTDRDGHQWVGKWRNGSSQNGQGAFEAFQGVSGKYIGATGGGVVTCTELSAGPRGSSVCVNKGELVIK